MFTTVDFTVKDGSGVELDKALTGVAVANGAVGQPGIPEHWAPVPANGNGPAFNAAIGQLEQLADLHAAVDHVFADESLLSGGA